MNTRDTILEEARRQLNEKGISQTSAKTVAESLGISDGNLRYHFRTKEALIRGLYDQLVERFNHHFAQGQDRLPLFEDFWIMLIYVFKQFESYSFLMLDFAAVMRSYPSIRDHYRQLQKQRYLQYKQLVAQWKEEGWLRTDLPDGQYQQLHIHMNAFNDYWISRAYILYEGPDENRVLFHAKSAYAMLVPYLTPAGMEEWNAVAQQIPAGY